MAKKASRPPKPTARCWSCEGEIAPSDNFCRQCGMKLQAGTSPSVNIHARLASIEKMMLRTIVGVVALLLLVGWILLQMYHFGRGGMIG
jgi:hypothetical protein